MNRVEQIRELRLEIDKLINSNGGIMPSRENSLAYTSLQRAKMFLGKCLQYEGTANPYPESKNPDSKSIEPQAEHQIFSYNPEFLALQEQTQTARVKFLRMKITEAIENFILKTDRYTDGSQGRMFMDTAYLALEEAGMWYGWELNRIKQIIDTKDLPMGSAPALHLDW